VSSSQELHQRHAHLALLLPARPKLQSASTPEAQGGASNPDQHAPVCQCVRCRYEGPASAHERGFGVEELRALGDLAMQQHRYPEAFRLYSQIVEAQPADADAMHARGGALLEAGLWPEAHAMFRDAAAQHPLHPGLLLHASKELAYQASETALEAETADAHAAGAAQREAIDVALPGSKELIPGRAFVTHGPLQVLSDLECDEGLRLAEDAAALSGGWTTARHYAVVLVPSSSRLPPRSSLLAPRSSLLAPRSALLPSSCATCHL